ncbi:SapC family protein [Desulfobotulus mexicanus]|uniref:SapC family protein n=1 Tax=Desulfobotulus mexicanus TaxID=2586642 RepID=UPI0015D131CF|nr:SapC family protein [Desulfobotulus mexicanus]
MTQNLEAISVSKHGEYVWIRSHNYHYAKRFMYFPLVGAEFAKACLSFPVLFMRDDSEQLFPVALLGLKEDNNLFVNPQGQWVGDYIPAQLRTYPFRIARTASDDKMVLCFDPDSALVMPEKLARGEKYSRIFDQEGNLSPDMKNLLHFYEQTDHNRRVTYAACKVLSEMNLFMEWDLKVQDKANGVPIVIKGFYRIDEAALEALPLEQLADLKNRGILTFIYSHLISTNLIERLEKMLEHQGRQEAAAQQVEDVDLDVLFGEDDDMLKF